MKDTKLTVTLHIGGKQVERLTPEQSERMAQRLTDVMSTYYTSHPEEYAKLKR
jgi:phenylpyruvate tautomerase PptA (4-oxalocrotonate tautomerase family)